MERLVYRVVEANSPQELALQVNKILTNSKKLNHSDYGWKLFGGIAVGFNFDTEQDVYLQTMIRD